MKNPQDYLKQDMEMGSIVTYTLSARSSNLHVGVVVGWNEKTRKLAVSAPSYGGKIGKTHISSGSGDKLTRVQVITPLYLKLRKSDQEILDLHDQHKNQQWPSDKPVRSIGSPIEKWLRSFERTCGDFQKRYHAPYGYSKDVDGYLLNRNSKKFIKADFSTTHDGETVYTDVTINDSEEIVGIYTKKGGRSYQLIDGMGKDLNRYSGRNPEPVFGINWFNHPDIVLAIKAAFEKVRNQ